LAGSPKQVEPEVETPKRDFQNKRAEEMEKGCLCAEDARGMVFG
jgi:hypothetical protein